MNRVNPILVCLVTLLTLTLFLFGFSSVTAQLRPANGPAVPHGKPFLGGPLPKNVTLKALPKGRAGAPPQTVDLTANTPTVTDSHPSWPKSQNAVTELPIIFQSNRADLQGTTVGALFHVYRMEQDGAAPTALTGPLSTGNIGATSEQTEPSFNATASTVVYIETTAAGNVDLVELNVNTGATRSLVKNNPSGKSFVALNHPEYGPTPSGNIGVIFAGQEAGQPFHLYAVDTQVGNVTQMTFGAFDDRNPSVSPDPSKPVIAFDRGVAGTPPTGQRDIYVIGINPSIQNVTRVTNFSVGGTPSRNIEPAWSTNKQDQPGGQQSIVNGQQLLAFASTRVDTNNDGNANAVDAQGRHDIYWLKVNVARDPSNTSVFTITNPESGTNVANKLTTSDPQHIYDDRHPAWPQFITTYRVVYQSDRTFYSPGTGVSGPAGQPLDIFGSTLIDINAPTLVRFNEITADIADVTPRLSVPGATVKISVKVSDLETGIRTANGGGGVFVQIKNPNSKYQGTDNKEHKVYTFVTTTADGGATGIRDVPMEYEMERIFAGADPSDSRVGSYASPRYIASQDDFAAFTGSSHPAEAGWLPLTLESRDPATGIETWSANYKTDNFASDYVIDVIVYDNALNPFGGGGGSSNWKIYDNIHGFSTAPFQAQHNILFVSDYSAGQKFFNSRFGTNVLTNVFNTFWGTESWLTDIDVNLFPKTNTLVPPGPIINWQNMLGVGSYFDGGTFDGTTRDGFPVPATQQYDLWRILCRGRLPDSVLQQYTPFNIQQPPNVTAGEKTPRTVLSAPRCVIWNAPYTGDLFTGPGTLTDLSVQTQLHGFLQAGGRLLVTGQDIGWGLTLDGSTTNSFYTNDLHAQYVTDTVPGLITRFTLPGAFPVGGILSGDFAMTAAGSPDPITWDPFGANGHRYIGPNTTWLPLSNDNPQHYLFGESPSSVYDTGSFGAFSPDHANPVSGALSDMTYGSGAGYIIRNQDAGTNSRMVYVSGGLENISDKSFNPGGNPTPTVMKAVRAILAHNTVCWMRTGTIVGQVVDTEGGTGIPNVLVRLQRGTNVLYTGLTKADGTFVIDGVERGGYDITAFKPGFIIQKATFVTTHGGFRDTVAFKMTKAEPDTIKGKVTRTDGTTPVIGATVTATDNFPLPGQTAATFTAITDANGNYSIERVPSQTTYTLTVSAPGFGESIPASYQVEDPADPSGNKFLQPAKIYQPYDFQLKAEPGSLTGTVFARNADGSKGQGIPNATVTATCGTLTVTAITDANGSYSFDKLNSPPNGLDPGVCTLVAIAPGYAANQPVSVTIITAQAAVAPDIILDPVPPGSISGLVTRTSDNSALPGVLIQLKDATGAVVTSTTTTALQTDANGYKFNYRISNAPAGVTYTVVATKSGFTATPLQQNAAVTSGVETKSINFQMSPLHTFAGQLSLVSSPYDYGSDPGTVANLLGVADSDPAFLFATWDVGRYVFFPTPPADRFRLGRGYFLGYKTNLPLSTEGTLADQTRPFDINLNAGWNLIGDPFLFDIDWTKVDVIDNGVLKSHDQAIATGAIGTALYSYVSGTYVLNFKMTPWVGYWVRAYRNVTLRIDPINDRFGRAAAVASGRAVLNGGDGWAVNLQVHAGELRDNGNYLGVSSRAADGFDGFKGEKPPVFGDKYVYLTFDHDNWGDRSGGYGVDIRSSAAATKQWDFTVQSTATNAKAVISWPDAAAVKRGTTLLLTDLATNTVHDMRTMSSYSWTTGDTPSSRKFRIEAVRSDATNTLRVTNVEARQISRGPGSASSPVNISYSLSMSANVEVRILGGNGAPVRSLTGRATRAAGINQASWDLKSDKNVAVPAGQYTVEIRAQTTDGKTGARQTTQVLVVR